MRGNKQFITFLIAFIGYFATVYSQTKAERLDKYFTKRFSDGEYANVLIAENGKVIYQRSFGNSNDSSNTKLNENSIFGLASVSKQFTAISVVMLKEKGKLNYTDDITKYLPEIPYKGITIYHLLHHTSGIQNFEEAAWEKWDRTKIASNKDVVEWYKENKPALMFPTGEKFFYCNSGYDLLALIVERVSGETFADFLQKNIFAPLEMKRTFVYCRRSDSKQVDNFAWDYVFDKSVGKKVIADNFKEYHHLYWLDKNVGGCGVHSTVNDLLKWDQALYTEKLVSKTSLDEMFTPGKLNSGKNTEYGMGFFISGKGNNLGSGYGKRVYHGGSWGGYGTWIERNIDQNKTIILLQNYTMNNHNDISKVYSILYDKK